MIAGALVVETLLADVSMAVVALENLCGWMCEGVVSRKCEFHALESHCASLNERSTQAADQCSRVGCGETAPLMT